MLEGEFNYAFNLSLKNRYVYVENAKSACTTLKSILGEWEFAGCDLGADIPRLFFDNVHVNVIGTPFVKPFQLGESVFNEILDSSAYYRFSFVRNPYTRLLSAYLDKVVRGRPEAKQIVDEAQRLGLLKPDENLSFVVFLRCIESMLSRGEFLDKHWRPQRHQLHLDRIRYNLIGKVEQLQEDIAKVAAALGAPPADASRTFGHETRASEQMGRQYDDESRELVARIYKADFEAFDYDFAFAY